MCQIHIKRAEISDAHIISTLGRATFTETFAELFSKKELNVYLEKTFKIEKLERSLMKSENIFGILFYQDNPVGYYKIKRGLHYDYSTVAGSIQLQKIYVLRNHLHLKLGKVMMSDILGLKEINSSKIIWLTVLHTNLRAIRFYEQQGFEILKKCQYQIGSKNLEYELMTMTFP